MGWLGWIGNAWLLVGMRRVGRKKQDAFLYIAIGEMCWAIKGLAVTPAQWDLVVVCVAFAVLAVDNFFNWGDPK